MSDIFTDGTVKSEETENSRESDALKNIAGFQMHVSDEVKTYPRMYYTTDFQAFCFIMRDLTLRSSSLCSANLNDPQEQRRVGITNYAGSKFIVCFSHIDHEQVPFWISYGGSDRATKILLKFKNFADNFSGAFYTDYAFIADKKKVFFSGTEYERTVNRNGIGQHLGCTPINLDSDWDNCIRRMEFFDVEYLPACDEAFSKSYKSTVSVDFSKIAAASASSTVAQNVPVSYLGKLGKQKNNAWENEGESRILCSLGLPEFYKWKYIDLRLKEEIFRELTVVLSPWCTGDFEQKVTDVIESSPISRDIKATIRVEHSNLEGNINI